MTGIRPRLAALREQDDGVTLAELMVAMGILTVLLVLAGSLLIYGSKIATAASFASTDSGVATNVMNETSDVIRFGAQIRDVTNSCASVPAVVQATPSSLMVYSYLTTDPVSATAATPTLVLLSVGANGQLQESRWPVVSQTNGCFTFPTISTGTVPATVSAAPASTRIIGGPLTPNSSGSIALFSYSDATGAAIAFSGGQIPAASLNNIATVQLDVAVNTGGAAATIPVHLTGSVSLQEPGTDF